MKVSVNKGGRAGIPVCVPLTPMPMHTLSFTFAASWTLIRNMPMRILTFSTLIQSWCGWPTVNILEPGLLCPFPLWRLFRMLFTWEREMIEESECIFSLPYNGIFQSTILPLSGPSQSLVTGCIMGRSKTTPSHCHSSLEAFLGGHWDMFGNTFCCYWDLFLVDKGRNTKLSCHARKPHTRRNCFSLTRQQCPQW